MFKSTKLLRRAVFVLSISFLLLILPQVFAADIMVDANCTLAQAIISANTDATASDSSCAAGSGADTIVLSGDITLSAALPQITSAIRIEGGGHVINGAGAHRIFEVGSGGELGVNNLAMTQGSADLGGGIAVNLGSLSITNSILFANSADKGAAIAIVAGTATITDSTLSDNSASSNGAGIAVDSSVLIVTSSTLSGNKASGNGGGIAVDSGFVTIIGSTLSGNSASGNGGGIYSTDNLTIINSTVSANSAASGGGLHADSVSSVATLRHATFTGNSGGVQIEGAAVTLQNSILYGNAASDCTGTLTQDVSNLIGTGNCSLTAITDNPKLGALVGSPAYHTLPGDSPAVDAASSDVCPGTDQTGTSRPQEAACDMGAFEYVKPVIAAAQAEGTQEVGVRAPGTRADERAAARAGASARNRSQPTPTPTTAPSTCLSVPSSIAVSGFLNATQCRQISGGGIGVPALIANSIDAIDIYGHVPSGMQVCFRQPGGILMFLDAATAPRTQMPLDGYSAAGMICTQIDRPGSIVLLPG